MKLNRFNGTKNIGIILKTAVGIGCAGLSLGDLHAQYAPADLSPGFQQVVRLNQAHMSDAVVLSYIKQSGDTFCLSPDDIAYLNSQGAWRPLLDALSRTQPVVQVADVAVPAPIVQVDIAPAPILQVDVAAPILQVDPAPPAAPEINLAYFQEQLTPYGTWIDVPGMGLAWMPNEVSTVPGWRPYGNAGHWIYTEDGWFWHSDYPWGEIAFHYGRWNRDLRYGWLWTPDYTWAPAWVAWRHAEGAGFLGWAPLPAEARFEAGVGLSFHGHFGAEVDFGLEPMSFTFVDYNHFWEPDIHLYMASPARVETIFRTSVVVNNYKVEGGRFIVEGVGHERMAALTHHEVRVEHVAIRDPKIAHAREVHAAAPHDARQHEVNRAPEHDTRKPAARESVAHGTPVHEVREPVSHVAPAHETHGQPEKTSASHAVREPAVRETAARDEKQHASTPSVAHDPRKPEAKEPVTHGMQPHETTPGTVHTPQKPEVKQPTQTHGVPAKTNAPATKGQPGRPGGNSALENPLNQSR